MLITTSIDLPGYDVTAVLGEVFGLTVRSRNIGAGCIAGFRSIGGGEIPEFTELLSQSRNEAMARMVDQTPVLAPDQTHGPIHGRARGLALARIRAEKPVRRVPRCAGPSLLQNQNHRKVCASIRPLLPRAIARVAMLTSLFLQVACVLTASRNQTPHGACCHLKAFLSMGAFCRPRRLLPILCSTSPCRW